MTLHELNILTPEQRKNELAKCCGATAWVNIMMHCFPIDDLVELLECAEEQWYCCTEADWKEAFTHHPKIGDIASLTKKFAATAQWASGEQSSVSAANKETIEALAKGNDLYEAKFGYIFIVCATGKSAAEMLDMLEARLGNNAEVEIKIAADEQNKITKLRLEKLVNE